MNIEVTPKGICALLHQVGESDCRIQNVAESCLEATVKKSGETILRIVTREITPTDIALDKGKIGLIVWFKKDKLPNWAKG